MTKNFSNISLNQGLAMASSQFIDNGNNRQFYQHFSSNFLYEILAPKITKLKRN